VPSNVDDHLQITASDTLNSSGSSSSSSTIYEYDSALSSISSEDESQFLDFTEVAKELPEVNTNKRGHCRNNSRHIIEPLISKSGAPVSQFSRPPLDKNRMFSSGEPTNEIHGHESLRENTKLFNDKLNTKPSDKENIEHNLLNSTCFNKRYNVFPAYKNTTSDVFQNEFSNFSNENVFNRVNTKHFVKITRHYAL
jgi:hypothetical protein